MVDRSALKGSRVVLAGQGWAVANACQMHFPDTPCLSYMPIRPGVVLGVNVGIYGSPMECLGLCLIHTVMHDVGYLVIAPLRLKTWNDRLNVLKLSL